METRQERNRKKLYGSLRSIPLKPTNQYQKWVKVGNTFISSSMTREEFMDEYFTTQKDFENFFDKLTSTMDGKGWFLIPDDVTIENFYDTFACDLDWASMVGACEGAAERNVEYANQQKAAEEKRQRDIALLNQFPACVRNVGIIMDSDTDNPYIKVDPNDPKSINSGYREYVFYKNGVLKAPRFNRTGTYTCNEFGSIKLNLDDSTQSTDSSQVQQPSQPSQPTQPTQPSQPGRPPLKARKCVGTYVPGCLNVDVIGQVERCLNLTSSRYPRGSGFYGYELDDKLKSLGYTSGFTDADVSKICSRNTAPENQVQEEDPVGKSDEPKETPRQTYEKYYAKFDGKQTDRIKLNMYNIPDQDLKNLNKYFATQGLFRIKNSKRRYKTSFVWGKKP